MWKRGLIAILGLAGCMAEEKKEVKIDTGGLPNYVKVDTLQATARDNSAERQPEFKLRALGQPADSVAHRKAGIWGLRYNEREFMLDVRDFKLGTRTLDADAKGLESTNKGEYAHVNLNNSLHLQTNDRSITADIPDGKYKMGCFLVRSYHESVKEARAAKFMDIEVRGGAIAKAENLKEAMIFYGVPMGDYRMSKSDVILLDFYLANASLSANGNKVKLEINANEPIILERWEGYVLEGLPKGLHKVKLTLLDRQGRRISDSVEKNFRIID